MDREDGGTREETLVSEGGGSARGGRRLFQERVKVESGPLEAG